MSKRLHPTLADYLVIAVSPALIMALVGSLVFFLLDIFYQGQFVERLHFVFACFVIAAVLIGRISIEMGSAHAMAYAAPLAIVTVLALGRFVVYPGGGVAAYSLWINVALVGLVLWCANKLTWDCTFIDESKEELGEGVLRTMGFDPPGGKKREEPSSGREPPTPEDVSPKKISSAVSGKPRPHSGGVWVVYFSLAALPLFGIGQRFLPAENLERRRYAFLLLCVYVASGLGLLLTTSFLGLRRYLRARRLQMPVAMAGAWVVIGCVLIAAILGFAVLLPRPSPEYAISEPPWKMTSQKREASRYAVGKEGTEDPRKDVSSGASSPKTSDAKAPSGDGSQRKSDGQEALQSGKARDRQDKGGARGKKGSQDQAKGDSKGDPGSSQDPTKADSQGDQKGSQDPTKDDSKGDQKGSQDSTKDDSKGDQKGSQDQDKSDSQGNQKGDSGQSKGTEAAGRKAPQDRREDSKRDAKSQGGSQADRSPPQTPPPAAKPSTPLPSWKFPLAGILKWLFYLALIVAVAYWAWKSRTALADTLREFLQMLRNFWANLFGSKGGPKKAGAVEAAAETKPVLRPFAEYADPFAAGWAEQWSPDELVRYTFAALEAWGREHGCARGAEQTAYEFADNIGDRSKPLGRHCRKMADLYSRAAYAPGTLPAASVAPLREFWQQLASA